MNTQWVNNKNDNNSSCSSSSISGSNLLRFNQDYYIGIKKKTIN